MAAPSPCIKTCNTLLVTACEQKEAYFCLYAHQIWDGPDTNDVYTLDPHRAKDFGAIRSDDWPLLDGTGADAKVVGRVQGQHIKNNSDGFNIIFNVIFQDDRYV
jgi:Dirigent-like protein